MTFKPILLFLLMGIVSCIDAQDIIVPNRYKQDEYAVHFGFCLGLNMMNFKITPNDTSYNRTKYLANVSSPNQGFNIQIISNFRLGEYCDLRFLPGISFGERDIDFYKNNVLQGTTQVLESNFLEFPLLFKYKAKRLYNIRPYVITGTNVRVDLAHNFNIDQDEFLQLKRFDVYYEAGGGIDFYFEYFKLSVELKYSFGLLNMLKSMNQTTQQGVNDQNAIQQLRSVLTILSFHFE